MRKTPLYRKVNTLAHGVHHDAGGEYRHERNSKSLTRFDGDRRSMGGKSRRGLDYTPLFRFLLSNVGRPWNDVYSEAVERLDRREPIFWIVARNALEKQAVVRIGEASYYSGLYVDDAGLLQIVDPSIGPESITPHCRCCTHTFNGGRVPFRGEDNA